MNILTFDVEDWFNCDVIHPDLDYSKLEVRVYDGTRKILDELDAQNQKATFFCLGWIAENHPSIIKEIYDRGHQIGCHSYQHKLLYHFSKEEFIEDTKKAKDIIENIIGDKVECYRAPTFSIISTNTWALEVLADLGFKYDCSIFPASRDYSGLTTYGSSEPKIIELENGKIIKEFPINVKQLAGKDIVYSGGGYFRLFPYAMIKRFTKQANYVMTYFHPHDFDPGKPRLEDVPLSRTIKNRIFLKGAFSKFKKYLNDFDFLSLEEADKIINWDDVPVIKVGDLK